MNQGNHDTISQLALIMQMYPDDKRRRQELAARVAAEIPAISTQIGADALAVVYEWLEANGAATSPTGHYRPFFVGGVNLNKRHQSSIGFLVLQYPENVCY